MCFSAEASFAASAAITSVGVVSLRKSREPSQRAFASIPLIFGVQQGVEGLLWLSLQGGANPGRTEIITYAFLLFAWVIWPLYVPLSLRLMEPRHKRKLWLNLLLAMGSLVSLILAYSLFFHDVQAHISGYHISYSVDYDLNYQKVVGVLYFLPIAGSLFISGVRKMWVVGILVLASFISTLLFYRAHLISVWCFFAAITSVSVLWVVSRSPSQKLR